MYFSTKKKMIACSLAIMCFATIAGLTQANSSSTTATMKIKSHQDPPGSNRMIRGGKGDGEGNYGRKLLPGGGSDCDPPCSSDEFCTLPEGMGVHYCVSCQSVLCVDVYYRQISQPMVHFGSATNACSKPPKFNIRNP